MSGAGTGDRRTRRTRQLLEQALLEAIEERSYESITVQQIAERADVGRATFYLHYADKEQLLLATLQRLVDDLVAHLPPLTAEDLLGHDATLLGIIFRHVARYRRLYRALLSERGSALVARRLRDHVAGQAAERVVEPLRRRAPAAPAVPASLLAALVSGALLSGLTWWLEGDCQEDPDEMAALVHGAVHPGLVRLLGLDAGC